MTPEELLDLSTLPQFPRTVRELIRIAGPEAAAKLVTAWPGRTFPVPLRTRNMLDGERRFAQLAEVVGDGEATRIVKHWGGQPLYVPSCDIVQTQAQHDAIRAQFDVLTRVDGYSYPEAVWALCDRFDCSDRTIENALKRPDNVRTVEAQGSLF